MNIETPINYLPPEMICEILKNLNLNDLIQCKLVSKRWYSIITESFKLIKLVVINDGAIQRIITNDITKHRNDIYIRSRWYYSNELVNNDLQLCEFNLFQVNLKRQILSNLKYLKIVEIYKFNFNQLNLLTQLIHLEINCCLSLNYFTLNLLELEVLRIVLNSLSRLSIEECPKLKILYYYYYNEYKSNSTRLIMKYPESITDLDSSFYGSELTQFKNVEYLKCNRDFNQINKNTLSKLKKLKVIYFNIPVKDFLHFLVYKSDEKMKLILRNYLKMIKELEMFDLKLYYFGLQITDHNIDQIDFGLRSNGFEYKDLTYFYALNYKYLQDSLPFISFVDYTVLVFAYGELDQAYFLWFLKNLKILKRLNLNSKNLNQSFYDELPTICSLIRFEQGEETNKELNLNFLIQFKELTYSKFEQELNLRSVKSIICAFKSSNGLNSLNSSNIYLKISKFRFKKQKFEIQRFPDSFNCDLILDSSYKRAQKRRLALCELTNYFEKLE